MTDERPVAVVWRDSVIVGEGGWTDRQTLLSHAEAVNRTVAFLVGETDDVILLAGSLDEANGNVCGALVIPRCSVVSMTAVEVVEAA